MLIHHGLLLERLRDKEIVGNPHRGHFLRHAERRSPLLIRISHQ